ncbi:MAG: NAD-dependent epimerase/dehydratase family protein [Candidatus Aenigmarchaeota archaeon]|nr:NAD-dependent epimerase/dehydratase family protein [Candidatus Aenigmarchaeota archaeon]
MKVLVTGGAGFIGSHLVDRLVGDGHEVIVIDSLEEQVHGSRKPDYLNDGAKYHFASIHNDGLVQKILDGVEVVFHQAAAVGVGQSMYEIGRYVDMNTLGTAKLLGSIARMKDKIKKLIVASSMSIYGEGAYECDACGMVYPDLRTDEQLARRDWEMKCPSCGKPVRKVATSEDKPLKPTSVYAITKRDQEELCLTVGRAYGIPAVSLRYFNVYGPRQSLSNPYTGVAAIFSSRLKNGNPPIIFEDGNQSRDLVSVHDIVEANIIAMKSREADFRSFNVGTGNTVTIMQVARTLADLLGKDIEPVIAGKYRSGDIRHCFADIGSIRKLGFEPKVGFKEGVRELVEWSEGQQATDRYDQAKQELSERGLISG